MKNETTQKLSEILTNLIESKKDSDYTLSEKKQASLMDIPYQTFHKYVTGIAECPVGNLVKISKYYNVTTDYLLGLTENPSVNEDIQIVCKTIGLSAESINRLIKIKNAGKSIPLELLILQPNFLDLIKYIEIIIKHSINKRYYEFLLETSNILEKLDCKNFDVDFIEQHILDFFNYYHFNDIQLGIPDKEIYNEMIYIERFKVSETFSDIIKQIMNNTQYDIKIFRKYNKSLLQIIVEELNKYKKILEKRSEHEDTADKLHSFSIMYNYKLNTYRKLKEYLKEAAENAHNNPKKE